MRLVLTPGEPAGIGPDLVIQCRNELHDCVIVADRDMLRQRAQTLGQELQLSSYSSPATNLDHSKGALHILHIPLSAPCIAGQLNAVNSHYVLATLDHAIRGCLQDEFAALITGPIHKGVINAAGMAFTGHTEYLAQATGAFPVMMLTANDMRVALVTTHLPLHQVPQAITRQRVLQVLRVVHQALRDQFGIPAPRVCVCGLNPHAGEDGYLGTEERDVIKPIILELQAQGLDVHGPFSADTLFTPAMLSKMDAAVAMYHDQGLPVIKHAGFGEIVNITLGLPIIRTSVDHGAALSLAGTGIADSGSLLAAVDCARKLARQARNNAKLRVQQSLAN